MANQADASSADPGRVMTFEGDAVAELAEDLARRGLELGPVIGRGAMALVYRAFDTRHDRSIAVKVLQADVSDRDTAARWTREISAVARLRHPNILPLVDSGITPAGTAYFLMPLAVGETLQARLQDGPLPIPEAVRYAREVAEALGYAHAEGLVHRDVKPGNILLDGGHAVLADFGLARPIKPEALRSSQLTGVGMVVGTPAYMSPEQLTADGAVDERSDLFALGVVLYEMLTGRLPFEATTMPGLITERLSGEFPPLSVLRPEAPYLLQQVITHALAPDPLARYARAESMVAELELVEHQFGRSAMAPANPFLPRWVVVTTVVVVLTVVTASLFLRRSEPLPLDPDRIVVADMRNETRDSTLAAIGAMASDLISAGMTRIPGLTVINSDLVFGAPRREDDRRVADTPGQGLRALVDSTRAATVVSGSYYRESGRLEVFAEITDAVTGRVLLDLGPLVGTSAHPDSVLAEASDSLTAFMQGRRGGKQP